MRRGNELACLALALAVSAARADIAPPPDRGPPFGSAAGLDFTVESVAVEYGPADGPHYQKNEQVAVLVACVDGHPNCKLARSRNLIGMQVRAVDGHDLRPENGLVQQILDAFDREGAAPTIALELRALAANSKPIKVEFARR